MVRIVRITIQALDNGKGEYYSRWKGSNQFFWRYVKHCNWDSFDKTFFHTPASALIAGKKEALSYFQYKAKMRNKKKIVAALTSIS